MKVFCPRFAILSRRSRPQLPPVYDDNFFCKPSFFIPTVFYTVTANISITEKGKEKTRAQITGKFNRRQPLFFFAHQNAAAVHQNTVLGIKLFQPDTEKKPK